jgi:hypothetical protein
LKLKHAIHHLNELAKQHPELSCIDVRRAELTASFNRILEKSGFPEDIIKANKISYDTRFAIEVDEELLALVRRHDAGRKATNDLPSEMFLPRYCRYEKAKGGKGEMFIIERHPGIARELQQQGKPMTRKLQWKTTSSKTVPLEDKYTALMSRVGELDQLIN